MTKTAQFELCDSQGTQNTETAAHRYLGKMAVSQKAFSAVYFSGNVVKVLKNTFKGVHY